MPLKRAIKACRDVVAGLTRYRSSDVVEEMIRRLSEALECDAALLVELTGFQSSGPVSALCRFCVGGDAMLRSLSQPGPLEDSVRRFECVSWQDYLNAPVKDPILNGWGARTVAILPIELATGFGAALMLLWRTPDKLPADFQNAIDPVWVLLQALYPRESALRALEEDHERLSGILETIPECVAFVDDNGEHGWINHQAAKLLELEAGTVRAAALAEAMGRLRARASNADEIRRTGERLWHDGKATISDWFWEFGEFGRVLCVSTRPGRYRSVEGRIWVFSDVTDQRLMDQALAESQRFSERILSTSPNIVYVYDVAADCNLYINQQISQTLGYKRGEVETMGDFVTLLCHPDDRPRLRNRSLRWDQGSESDLFEAEFRARHTDGSWRWLRLSESAFYKDEAGHVTQVLGVASDVTSRIAVENELREQQQRWQLALDGASDGIWDWDAVTGQVFYSPRWKQMLGFEPHELPDTSEIWEELVHPDDLPRAKQLVQDHLNRKTAAYIIEYRIRHRDGQYIWVLARGRALWDENGRALRMVGSHSDITERKNAEDRLSYQAAHDALTGLSNRRHFLARMESMISDARRAGESLVLCVCDIDHFKLVNDNHGHGAGDDVLVSFSRVLREGVRRNDIVGRMGGDEFYVLFAETTVGQAALSLDRIRNRWAGMSFNAPGGGTFSVTSTFGAAPLQDGMDSKALIEAADQALYRAKQSGRNRVEAVATLKEA